MPATRQITPEIVMCVEGIRLGIVAVIHCLDKKALANVAHRKSQAPLFPTPGLATFFDLLKDFCLLPCASIVWGDVHPHLYRLALSHLSTVGSAWVHTICLPPPAKAYPSTTTDSSSSPYTLASLLSLSLSLGTCFNDVIAD
jgi:hypothetical protein